MDEYLVTCWNCAGEYDALSAVWCNCDARNPTKLCPFCIRCFCSADRAFHLQFWKNAPAQLLTEKSTLNSSRGQLGQILVSSGLLTVQQLIGGLTHSRASGTKFGEALVAMGVLSGAQVDSALETQAQLMGAARTKAPVAAQPAGSAQGPASTVAHSPAHLTVTSPDMVKDALNNLLLTALKKHASALYLEPAQPEATARARIDGVLFKLKDFPAEWLPGMMRNIKRMAHLNIDELRMPQSGRFALKLGEKAFDVAVQTLPGSNGEGAGLMLVNRERLKQDLSMIGFEPADHAKFIRTVEADQGVIIISGPLFNSVTETAYSILSHQAERNRKVVSLEAPITATMPGVNQLEVRDEAGFGFVQALKTAMNLSPDTVFLSDLADPETLRAVVRPASAIQLIAAMDCSTTFQVLDRLKTYGPVFAQALPAIRLIISQRVIRKVCSHCLERRPITPAVGNEMGLDRDEIHLVPEVSMGRGCSHCNDIGYAGTRTLIETLAIDDEIRGVLLADGGSLDLEKAATRQNFSSLRLLHLREVAKLATSPEEYIRGDYPRPALKRIFRVK